MRLRPRDGASNGAIRALSETGRHPLLSHDRRRRHAAILTALVVVSLFAFVIAQPRTVRVLADGRDIVVRTHRSNDGAVLAGVGVEVRPGDRVTAMNGAGGDDVLRVERARDVTVLVDNERYRLRTHAITVEQVLAEAGAAVNARDSILLDGALVPMNAQLDGSPALVALFSDDTRVSRSKEVTVEVRRAVTLRIVEDGRELVSTSSRPTVAQVLREAGITVGPGDLVEPPLETQLAANMNIAVQHAKALTVALPSEHQTLYTLAETVGEALDAVGITLPEGAVVDPPVETPVRDRMSVRVVQLSGDTQYEREFMESATIYRADASLPPGETRTVPGNDGVLVRRYDVAYVNGEEVSRTLADEYYDPEPVDTVIYYPTRTGRNEQMPSDSTVARTMRVYATWYNPASSGRAPSDPAYGRTATGVMVTYGVVAVDPNVIPLGTRMFIPGYGYAVAADTGGAVKGYIIDLGFPDGVAVDWRTKWLDIYILS